MPPICNIDGKGRIARLVWGLLLIIIGAALCLAWARGAGSWLRWGISMLTIAGGLFALYEARSSWCVVRAMGIKTPL